MCHLIGFIDQNLSKCESCVREVNFNLTFRAKPWLYSVKIKPVQFHFNSQTFKCHALPKEMTFRN